MAKRGTPHRRRLGAAIIVGGLMGGMGMAVAGCASSTPSAATGTSAPSTSGATGASTAGTARGTAPANATTTTWHTELTSKSKQLHNVGPDDQLTYGWNQLVGTTTIDGAPADVELLGSVDYVKGSGPWWGFFTLTVPSGTLAFRATGDATLDGTSKNTAFTGNLQVIGGTGRYVGAAGTATATGTRLDALGGQVDFDITMTLTGVAG